MPNKGRHIRGDVQGKSGMVFLPVQFSIGDLPERDKLSGASRCRSHRTSINIVAGRNSSGTRQVDDISTIIGNIRKSKFVCNLCNNPIYNCRHAPDIFQLERYKPVIRYSRILHSFAVGRSCPSLRITPSNLSSFEKNPWPFVFSQSTFSSIGRSLKLVGLICGSVGGSFCVADTLPHELQLPEKQPRLDCSNKYESTSSDDEPQCIESDSIVRRPLPQGFGWLVLFSAAIGVLLAGSYGIVLFVLAYRWTRPRPDGENSCKERWQSQLRRRRCNSLGCCATISTWFRYPRASHFPARSPS